MVHLTFASSILLAAQVLAAPPQCPECRDLSGATFIDVMFNILLHAAVIKEFYNITDQHLEVSRFRHQHPEEDYRLHTRRNETGVKLMSLYNTIQRNFTSFSPIQERYKVTEVLSHYADAIPEGRSFSYDVEKFAKDNDFFTPKEYDEHQHIAWISCDAYLRHGCPFDANDYLRGNTSEVVYEIFLRGQGGMNTTEWHDDCRAIACDLDLESPVCFAVTLSRSAHH